MILSGNNICKKYNGRVILRDCNVRIDAGQCLLLRGPSGAGKSTLLRILALLEQADGGEVVHGTSAWNAAEPHSVSPYPFLTVVFQQLFLWPTLTVAQNISFVLTHRPDRVVPLAAMEMLDRLGVAHAVDRHPHECSLGECQRVALARALLSDARFLLLDEPSSALDRASLGVVIAEIKTALANGRGTLIISHDDRGFDSIAETRLELENGELRKL